MRSAKIGLSYAWRPQLRTTHIAHAVTHGARLPKAAAGVQNCQAMGGSSGLTAGDNGLRQTSRKDSKLK